MRKLRAMFFIVILFCSLTSAFADKPALPSTPQSVPALTKNQQEGEGFDIVLLMDSSGSMKKTDPRNYRKAAARLFISLFGSDDRIGVISFGDSSKTLIGLTQNSGKNRQILINAIGKISSREFATNITAGVERGFDELKPSQRRNRMLLLMSDGKLALGSKEKDEAAFKELSGLLPELAKSNIKIYSIAFTESSDIKLLEGMVTRIFMQHLPRCSKRLNPLIPYQWRGTPSI
ncbi:MAG: VWA domain-containing protein [Nitrospirae bacterium]|nr:VWA domain-containing protein [Nitrospirota bacterium]